MRAAALTALARTDPTLFVTVISGLDPDPHWSVRAALATALGSAGRGTRPAAADADAAGQDSASSRPC